MTAEWIRVTQWGRGIWAASFCAGTYAASSAVSPRTFAMGLPDPMEIDGGPIGPLDVSGGADGYFYNLSNSGSLLGNKSIGFEAGSALIKVQEMTHPLQFTIEIGAHGGATALGTRPAPASVNIFSTGPLQVVYLTLAPANSPVTISVGHIGSIEGFENGNDWDNANQLVTELFYTESGEARGVEASYAQGPISLTGFFGDGYDTGVFNFLQAYGSYSFDAENSIDAYYGGNLGRTGLNAHIYGEQYANSTVAEYGAYYPNSQMAGFWYSWTKGNLNLVPEVQYQWAKTDHKIGLRGFSSNLGTAIFVDYLFVSSPYSIGAWAEAWTSNGPDSWFIAPGSSGEGISVSPTWQYKHLYTQIDFGVLRLNSVNGGGLHDGYGKDGRNPDEFTCQIGAGIVF